jgi:pimeloyl-ACP methyl ester carboxylesterase
MSRAVAGLLEALDVNPQLLIGHSAGAAVASTLCLQGSCNPRGVISINGALLPFGRAAAPVFSRAARLLASMPVFPQLVALHAVPRKPVERMLRQTGSAIPPEMVRCYRELLGNPRHVAGTLRMMANWDLPQLERNLDRLNPALSCWWATRIWSCRRRRPRSWPGGFPMPRCGTFAAWGISRTKRRRSASPRRFTALLISSSSKKLIHVCASGNSCYL